jgi:hypothetical protein
VLCVGHLRRLWGGYNDRHVDDGVIGVYAADCRRVNQVVIYMVVVVCRRPVAMGLIDVISIRMHVQLGRLNVHQRECRNESKRKQLTDCFDHLIVNHRNTFRA